MGNAGQNESQLPTKVPGILNSGVHALTTDGTVDMSGITCKEDATIGVTPSLSVVQSEVGEPGRIPQTYNAARSTIDNSLRFADG